MYAQRELSMTGFTSVSDMTWSIVSAGREKITVMITRAVAAALWVSNVSYGGGPSERYVLGVWDLPPPPPVRRFYSASGPVRCKRMYAQGHCIYTEPIVWSGRSSPMSERQLGKSSLTNASSLVLLQLFSRAFTFGLNQALVRLATPQTFGTAAIQFELLLSTILFLSREGVRNALLRSSVKSQKKDSNVALTENISLIPVFLGVPISGLAALVYVQSASTTTTSQPHFHLSVAVYALAAVLELLSEPLYVRAQNELRLNVRVRAEGAAVVSKAVVTFLVLAFASGEWALVAFAVGQAAYGFSLLVAFWGVYKGDINYVPKPVRTKLHDKCASSLCCFVQSSVLTCPQRTPMRIAPRHRISMPSY